MLALLPNEAEEIVLNDAENDESSLSDGKLEEEERVGQNLA